jgi:hypothetical protein
MMFLLEPRRGAESRLHPGARVTKPLAPEPAGRLNESTLPLGRTWSIAQHRHGVDFQDAE